NAVHDGTLGKNAVLSKLLQTAKNRGGRLHLFGLVSDGGVHSSLVQLLALIDLAEAAGVKVVVHAFLDGRDVQPKAAPGYLARVREHLGAKGVLGTVSGRYWAMDRDNRWERVERAYQAIVHANAPRFSTEAEGVASSFANGKTDEFVEPFVVD